MLIQLPQISTFFGSSNLVVKTDIINENVKQFYTYITKFNFKKSTITTLSSKNLLESFVF